eukprot:1946931-Alexandrium_andersonii.AAC.1
MTHGRSRRAPGMTPAPTAQHSLRIVLESCSKVRNMSKQYAHNDHGAAAWNCHCQPAPTNLTPSCLQKAE